MQKPRKLLVAVLVALALGLPARCLSGAQGEISEKKQLKLRHREERKAFKFKKKQLRMGVKGPQFTRAVRLQMKHQLQREGRELRQRQKNDLQDMKDRQRMLKEYQQRQ